jgi:hypothetical protein
VCVLRSNVIKGTSIRMGGGDKSYRGIKNACTNVTRNTEGKKLMKTMALKGMGGIMK